MFTFSASNPICIHDVIKSKTIKITFIGLEIVLNEDDF